MGAAFIFSVISTLSSLLSSLRSSGATSADSSGDEIERDLDRLERLLKRIQAALRDAGEREIRDEYVKLWLKELQAVAYEAEDILDECQYELLRRQIEDLGEAASSSADGKKRKRLDGVISVEMAERIKNVIEQFDEISHDKDALCLKEDDGERRGSVWTGMSPTSHLVNESAIFGRDEDKQNILDFVLSGNTGGRNQISVMTIVGMGGVGKTTLAQLVYNDSHVQNHFDLRAWVYVSPDCDVIKITKQVLENITSGKLCSDLIGLSAAQKAIVEIVNEKKVFIVLDDVWNESPSKWEQFLEPLRAAEFVKIIMTTRNEPVAQKSGVTDTHNLSCLSENQSRLLFEHYAYGGQFVDEYSCLKEIGVQIVKKCAGLPLAIKSIGRALSYQIDEDSWRHILDSGLWESDDQDEIFRALKVSYYNLPSGLKPCFLFCSLFPKGSLLVKETIIYMWIAHGYIRPCSVKRAEDIANEFIQELLCRSFLTKDKIFGWDNLEYFTMHDLMHDLARSISTDEVCTITNKIVAGTYHTYTMDHGILDRLSHRPFMRTLISDVAQENCEFADLHHLSNERMCINLRVLTLSGACMHDLEHIGNLVHLRYLELENGKMKRLPDSMSRLYNLVAIRLSSLDHLTELPMHTGKLLNLRFLDMFFLGIRALPESLGQLCNLQHLSVSYCEHLEELPTSIGNLTSLKELHLSYLNVRELPESVCMLRKLQKLSIKRCSRVTQIPSDFGDLTNLQWMYCSGICIKTLPKSMNSLCNLKVLELSCSGSPFALLCGFGGLLERSSLNFSIKRSDGRKQKSRQIRGDWCKYVSLNFSIKRSDGRKQKSRQIRGYWCKYVKTQRLIESLQSVSYLVKLEINGYQGIGYAFSKKHSFNTAIAMHCHFKNGNFFRELGELPSLKSLSLVRITSVHTLQLKTPPFSISQTSKVLFSSLIELELVDMPEWSVTVGTRDGDFPVLKSLKIENCAKLSCVPNCGNNLRKLEIIRCSFVKLELDLLNLQLLENLYIEECLQLTLLKGLQSLNSIRALYLLRCPLLKEFLYPVMPTHPLSIDIVACPLLEDLCYIKQLNYIKDFSCKALVTSGNWNIMKPWNQNIFVEHLVIRNCFKQSLRLNGRLYNLTTLEVRNCWKLETLEGLGIFEWLRKLVLWDCPQLQLTTSQVQLKKPGNEGEISLPPNLQSLAVHGCHNILSLNLLTQDRLFFTELEVTDCKRLMGIFGLHELTKLETLAIIQCPQLLLEPLQDVPEYVVISGCPRLKAWCQMHSVEPLDDETD